MNMNDQTCPIGDWDLQLQPQDSVGNMNTIGYVQTYPYYYYPTKTAREQVQDEILVKMAAAIEKNDLKEAKKLVELAKALKEL